MNLMEGNATLVGDREIASTRLFDAPRELVWKVWTEPEHLAKWWGPNGFTNTIDEMDVRPGGVWRMTMHGPDGTNYPNKIIFVEVVTLERLVFKHVTDNEAEPVHHETTVNFSDKDGKTEIEFRMVLPSANARDYAVQKFGAVEGLNQTLSHLVEYLATFG